MTPQLTDEQLCEIARSTETAEPGRDGYILPVAFARAVIAAGRELQDAKLANAPTDGQIDEALKVFACTVIGADRATQDARHLEELRASDLTISNLRAEVARLTAACDKMSEAEMLGCGVPDGWRLVPVDSTPEMLQAVIDSGAYHDNLEHARAVLSDEYRTQIVAAPQPPAQPSQAEQERDAIAELNHAQWLALENVRLLAAWHRKEEWAQHMLRFCAEAGVRENAIHRAQTQPPAQPEPVGCVEPVGNGVVEAMLFQLLRAGTLLYASAPPEREPMTDAEIEKAREATFSTDNPYCPVDSKSMRKAARAVEAFHGIKETS